MLYSCNIYKIIITILLFSVLLAPYLSSWLPLVFGFPAGSVFRSFVFVLFFMVFMPIATMAAINLNDKYVSLSIFIYLLVIFSIILLFFLGGSSIPQFIIGMHSFVVYPAVFLVLYLSFLNVPIDIKNDFFVYSKTLVAYIFIFASLISLVDVLMSGEFVIMLGYNPNYGGEGFELIRWYYDRVRANGGFADALVFGYLMVVAVIFFLNEIYLSGGKYKYYVGLYICSLAVIFSITRGAILVLFFVYLSYFFKSKYKFSFVVLGVAALLLVYVSGYFEVFLGRFTDSDPASRSSTMLRWEMAVNAVNYLSQHPFGAGIGTQGAGNILSVEDQRINTDNFLFHVLIEMGLYFGPIFILFWLAQLYLVLKNASVSVVAYLLVFLSLISSLFSSSLQSATLSVYFWFVAYLITNSECVKYKDDTGG